MRPRRRGPRHRKQQRRQACEPHRPSPRASVRERPKLPVVHYANSLLDLIGNTPLVKLDKTTGRRERPRAREGGVPQPGRVGEGPDRHPDDRGRRGVRRAASPAARSSSPPRATPGSGWRWSPRPSGYHCVFVCPDKVSEDKQNVLKAYGARGGRLPDGRRARAPRLLLQRLGPAGPRDRGRLEAQPVRQREQPALALRDHRPGDLGADRGQDHPLRRRRRHRRHDQRHRPLPQGAEPRRPGDRRRPGRLGLLRRHRPALPRRGRRRGLLAHHLRPRHRRPDHRGLRRGLLRLHPPAGPRGGDAGRRLVRDGRVRGGPARPASSTTPTR